MMWGETPTWLPWADIRISESHGSDKEGKTVQRNEKGEAFVAMLAIMLAGGLVLWLATGNFHMMPGHGGVKGMHKQESSPAPAGLKSDSAATPPRVDEDDNPERSVGPRSRRDDAEPLAIDSSGGRYPDSLHWNAGDKIRDPEGMPRDPGGIKPAAKT